MYQEARHPAIRGNRAGKRIRRASGSNQEEAARLVLLVVGADDGPRVERRKIRIGARRPGEVEVLDGLDEGDRVVTHGAIRVRPGQSVQVRAVETGAESLTDLLRQEPTAAARDKPQ